MDLNTPAFKDQLSQSYGLPSISGISAPQDTKHSTLYFVDVPSQPLYLKKYQHPDLEHILKLHQLKTQLQKSDQPIHVPLSMSEGGSTLFRYVDNYYSLFPVHAGTRLNPKFITPAKLHAIGSTLAKLHLASQSAYHMPDYQPRDFDSVIHHAADILRVAEKRSRQYPADQLLTQLLHTKIATLGSLNHSYHGLGLPSHVVLHRNLPHYLHFNQNQLSPISHWDRATKGPRILEILQLIDQICLQFEYNSFNYLKAHVLLNAYHQVYPILKAELEQGLRAYQLLMLTSLRAEQAYIDEPTGENLEELDRRQHAVQYMNNNLPEIRNQLISALHDSIAH